MPTNPYAERTVLVTGGTGSFGNFVVRRLLQLGAREVRVLSRDEKKQYDMRVFYQQRPDLSFIIGDVRSRAQLDEAMSGAQIIFHAAALKSPGMQANAEINLGTRTVLQYLLSPVQKTLHEAGRER
jgi:FlaA1/EpsC-like NDP-sugar epimerase